MRTVGIIRFQPPILAKVLIEWQQFVAIDPVPTPQWTPVEYSHQGEDDAEASPDLRAYRADGLMIYTAATLPLDIMRGRRCDALREWLAPYHREIRGVPSYFSLERPLESSGYTVMFWVEREAWGNQLLAQAIGRGT